MQKETVSLEAFLCIQESVQNSQTGQTGFEKKKGVYGQSLLEIYGENAKVLGMFCPRGKIQI